MMTGHIQRREFEYRDGKSEKFWAIQFSGAAHTVQFGRIGTTGQTKTKEFESEDAARKSYDKLVAEKLNKGYVEVTAGAAAATPATSKSSGRSAATAKLRKKTKPAEAVKAEPERTPAAEPSAGEASPVPSGVETAVLQEIRLAPEDWLWATWRPRTPKPRPEPKPFDKDDCLKRLKKMPLRGDYWRWGKMTFPEAISPEEAVFWFMAMTRREYKEKPTVVAERLGKTRIAGSLSLEEVRKWLECDVNLLEEAAMRFLGQLLPPDQLLDLMLGEIRVRTRGWATEADLRARMHLANGFRLYVLPYLAQAEVDQLKEWLRPRVDPSFEPADSRTPYPIQYHLGAMFGLGDRLAPVIAAWQVDRYAAPPAEYYHQPQRLVFGLDDPKLVEAEFRRLQLHLRNPEQVRAWLAHTEFSALDVVRDNILSETRKDDCGKLLKTFALAIAPEVAEPMLECKLSSKAPGVAGQWLDEHVGTAVAGLISTAAGSGKLAHAAIDYLREKKQQGLEPVLRSCLAHAPRQAAEAVQREVLDQQKEKTCEPLDDKSTPRWLGAALDEAAGLRRVKVPAWVAPGAVPPLVVGDRCLSAVQCERLVAALSASELGKPHILLSRLREHCDPDAVARFAWGLFARWLQEGARPKEKWAMRALGFFGTDATALQLTPLIRAWPGESQHQRAVLGLECLRAIGTDTALMQLNGVAQKVKFKGIQKKAVQCMEEIAKERGMTGTQLEDRIVPDCDLNERGTRSFDFGPRKFTFVLGPGMKPMVRDEEGKIRKDLPKPGAKDDRPVAEAAVREWKLLKKQVRQVAKIQAGRLEQAMVTGRTWGVEQFNALLVRHPLMTNLVRLLLWGGYDKKGQLKDVFRVTEEQDFSDVEDKPLTLAGVESVRIVHPLHLSEGQKSAWGEVFSDYALIPPFAQLGRPVFHMEKAERGGTELTRLKGKEIPATALVGTLERLGWIRGIPEDAGVFGEHSKPFYGAKMTAILQYEDGVPVGYMEGWGDQEVTRCFFVPGVYTPVCYPRHEKMVKLGQVDAVVISEVLSDLATLGSKSK